MAAFLSVGVADGQGALQTGAESTRRIDVHAVAGIIALERHKYLLVIVGCRCRGAIGGRDVFEVSAMSALPLDSTSSKDAFQELFSSLQSPESSEESRTAEPPSPELADDRGGGPKWLSPQISRMFWQQKQEPADTAEAWSSSVSLESGDALDKEPPVAGARAPGEDVSSGRMESRVLDEIVRIFSTSGMFFSYDYDLTRSLQAKGGIATEGEDSPLACIADPAYWFNHNIQQPLLRIPGGDAWALPLVQGSVQIGRYQIAESDVLEVCVVSRRNCRRIGMRYERRGANASGDVANFVETEQIAVLETQGQPAHHVSFVQTRGSMPFLWKQPPSGLHPVPVVTGDSNENAAACAKHIQHEIDRLGRQVLVSLVEHRGREDVVGSAYTSTVGNCVSGEMVDVQQLRYVPWDFHNETRGMRYENLQQLVEQLRREATQMSYFWSAAGQALTRQQGAFRVNCMDCLDRTNVVQSALARSVLNEQLVRLGVHAAPDQGLAAYPGLEPTLNTLWANNGDYISRQYAGTSAMKGDFTRTGKRNISGMVNDATYSLTRLWMSTFRDYFSQSVLDFLMGSHAASAVFRTLVDLRSREPEHAQQVRRMREAAIVTSVTIALGNSEQVQLACIVHSPMAPNTLKMRSGGDSVLAVTDAAVYVCSYCYQREKVSEFVRIELATLARVQYGAYITSTRTPQCLDPARNNGLVLSFIARDSGQKSGGSAGRGSEQKPARSPAESESEPEPEPANSYIACKLVREAQVVMKHTPDGTLERLDKLENQTPDTLAECLCSAMLSLRLAVSSAGDSSQFLVDAPIISVSAARQQTSLLDRVSIGLHNAFWI
ncbi:hypothetical protein GGF46_001433 [Coemansia sp. RSA 552]|nr:hypothetical protein GGF46_001433 [Coemansia sp. RSA 552]